ncbi:MAG: sulfatase-like hydrolase/transferase [Mycobacteriales bacterium]
MTGQPPNIIYIHTHDSGRYVQPYGHAVPTPALQGLAERGVLFRQAFSAAPTCSPSRAALLTGQWPHQSGMLGLAHFGFRLNDFGQHVIHPLRAGGYRAVLAGVQHIAAGPAAARTIGYDEQLDTGDGRAAGVSAAAVDFLHRGHDAPFFLSVGFTETHTVANPPAGVGVFGYPPVESRYVAPPPPLPDSPPTRADMASFIASAAAMDDAVGRVLRTLDETGLAPSTLVIATTDHGVALPGMKCTLTDHGIGVLLILAGPEPFTGARVVDAPVSHLDLYPTICDLAGVPHPSWLQGRSLVPLPDDPDREIFAEINYHAAYEPHRAIRTGRWKLIRSNGADVDWGGPSHKPLANVDDTASKQHWVEAGWADRPVAAVQLYDLLFDPQERHDVADDPAYADVRHDLDARLTTWMRRTADPLLRGPIPQPDGAPIRPPDALSPSRSAPSRSAPSRSATIVS